jgi:hypothetical protein
MGWLGGRLRSRLLVGAASMALAAPIAGKAKAQDARWQPWLEAGGMVGTDHSFGDVDIFLPVWQDQTSMLFGDLRGKFSSEPTEEGNFGLGYRTQVDPRWILGGYGYVDIQNSKNDNLFYQATLGIEALTVDWDIRLNGYIPFNGGGRDLSGNNGSVKISGNTIGITHQEEKPLYGFDGEVGWRLPIFPADGDMDVRAFIGGYYFTNSDVDTVAGPRGRLEVRLYDLDVLGVQSRLTVDGEVQWDQPRGTQAFGGLELRIPLGLVAGAAGPKLSPLDRRMVDRVQRDVDIVTQTFDSKPADVIVDGLTVKTHTIVFAEAGGTGNGTKGNPTDLQSAVNLFPNGNAIIVVEGENGPFIAGPDFASTGLQLHDGQALIGGGATVPLHAADGRWTASFHAPGDRPTLQGSSSAFNLVNMYSGGQNRVTGLDLVGSFGTAIFGSNMQRAIITDNFIDPPPPPLGNGIFLQNAGSGVPTSQFLYVARNTVVGAPQAQIAIHSYLTDGLAHSQTIAIVDNTVTGGRYGIAVRGVVSALPGFTEQVEIAGNSIGIAGVGILFEQDLSGIGGGVSLSQSFDGNSIGIATSRGIFLSQSLSGISGGVSLSQSFDSNSFASVADSGIFFNQVLEGIGGGVSQTQSFDNNSIASAADAEIFFTQVLEDITGGVSQSQSFDNNSIGSAVDAIILDQFLSRITGEVSLSQSLDNNSIASAATGIDLLQQLGGITGGVSLSQSFDNNSIGSARYGIFFLQLLLGATAGGVSLSQSFDNNSIGSASRDGILVAQALVDITGGVSQSQSVDNNSIASAATGIELFQQLEGITGGVSLSQSVDNNGIGSAAGDGISFLQTLSAIGGGVSLSQSVDANSIASAAGDGISFLQTLYKINGGVSQSQSFDNNSIGSAGLFGIFSEQMLSEISGGVSQSHSVDNNSIGSRRFGILFEQFVDGIGGGMSQSQSVDNNSIGSGDGDGIVFGQFLVGISGGLSQSQSVDDNSIGSAAKGIFFDQVLGGISGGVSQSQSVDNNSIGSAATGIFFEQTLSGISGGVGQSQSVDSNSIGNAGNGIFFHQLLVGASGDVGQDQSVDGNSIGSASSGIFLDQALSGISGDVGQDQSVDSNSIGSAGNGIGLDQTVAHIGGSLTLGQSLQSNSIGKATEGIGLSQTVFDVNGGASAGLTVASNSVAFASGRAIYLIQSFAGVTLAQTLSIAGNSVSAAGANGITSLLYAASGAAVTQLGRIDTNNVQHAAGNGLDLAAGGSGTVGISLDLSGNALTGNGKNGFAASASGAGVSEAFTLVTGSGNQFTSNTGAGVFLSNAGGGSSITFQINAATGNDVSTGNAQPTSTAGTVIITP